MDFPEDLAETVKHQLGKRQKGATYILDDICEEICPIYPDYSPDLVSAAIKHFGPKMGIGILWARSATVSP